MIFFNITNVNNQGNNQCQLLSFIHSGTVHENKMARECLLKHMNFNDFKHYRIGINKNKPFNYKYLASVINELKLQNVYHQSTRN